MQPFSATLPLRRSVDVGKFKRVTNLWSDVFGDSVTIVIDLVGWQDGLLLVCRTDSCRFGSAIGRGEFNVLRVRVSLKEGAHSGGFRVCWRGSIRLP
jgi:hypothetical protein